jgi:hypothetical protein
MTPEPEPSPTCTMTPESSPTPTLPATPTPTQVASPTTETLPGGLAPSATCTPVRMSTGSAGKRHALVRRRLIR